MTHRFFGRLTSATLVEHPGINVLLAVRHGKDSSCKRVHIHYVLETKLSDKKLRAALRLVSGLDGRMDLHMSAYDFEGAGPDAIYLMKYLLNHGSPDVLVCTSEFDAARSAVEKELLERPKPTPYEGTQADTMRAKLFKIYCDNMVELQEGGELYYEPAEFINFFLSKWFKQDIVDHSTQDHQSMFMVGSMNAWKSYVMSLWFNWAPPERVRNIAFQTRYF